MKRFLTVLAMLLLATFAQAQQPSPIVGDWSGKIKVQGMSISIVLHIVQNDTTFITTLDSPDQGGYGYHASATSFVDPSLTVDIATMGAKYIGKLEKDSIVGTFNQNGFNLPLTIKRLIKKRPQEPVKPYPYYTEDVSFRNEKANISLGGTLTLPSQKGKYPVVVFITGSGVQNRDEEAFGHKPFLVIADNLARHGIASLRFDDRGVGQSGGSFQNATSADFATDVECAISYLKTRKEIDKSKIGLIGHSEGGLIAPMVASKRSDVNCIVMLAGPGLRGDKVMHLQTEAGLKSVGAPETLIQQSMKEFEEIADIVVASSDAQQMRTNFESYVDSIFASSSNNKYAGLSKQDVVNQLMVYANPKVHSFYTTDPAVYLKKTRCVVLAVNGGKDIQVLAKENIAGIQKSLSEGGNKDVTVQIFPNVNHALQECETGAVSEYNLIEQTVSLELLDYITKWIIAHSK